ncbi:acyl carrier protein [Streptomyces sp. SBST2-5]|uniref:Acyl carrier protein n=1 Tax=Streptomyces composti TaxID=2720025 RepID=A0ABX1A7U7_9ACTN|nr:phosphopantetheine-binding protein [Streptomyces composti]NJP51192.1 acyl carrier protein [Streptomyces composti]
MSAQQDRLFSLVADKLGVDPEQLTPTATFDALDLDSLLLIELSVIVEKEFGVQLDETALSPDNTLGDVLARIDAKAKVA